MQINAYQSVQTMATPAVQPQSQVQPSAPEKNSVSATEAGVQVNISAQAQALSQNELSIKQSSQPEQLPTQPVQTPEKPSSPLTGESLEQAAQFKKAQAQYQVHSDMANMMLGNETSISASTAHYLSNNEDAREAVLQSNQQQNSADNLQHYQETTQNVNDQYAV